MTEGTLLGRQSAPDKTRLELLLNPDTLRAVSIATRTGDDGTTGLMYGRRVPKHHVRVEAYGAVDELNAALGMARALAQLDRIQDAVLRIQKDLVAIMGELATALEDQQRYAGDGYPGMKSEMIQYLDQQVAEFESQSVSLKGWAIPGTTQESTALDVARTVCRRAERRISEMLAAGELPNAAVLTYFNRLADLLWLMARSADTRNEAVHDRNTS